MSESETSETSDSDWDQVQVVDGGYRERYVSAIVTVLLQAVQQVGPTEWDHQLLQTAADMENAGSDPEALAHLQDAVVIMKQTIAEWRAQEIPDEIP